MDNNRFSSQKHSTKSGYEPSDTETEWQEVPRHERERKNIALDPEDAKAFTLIAKSPLALHRRHQYNHSKFETETSSATTTIASVPSQPRRRQHHSKSPFKLRVAGDDDGDDTDDHGPPPSPIRGLNTRRNISPLPKPDVGRTVSPYSRKHHGSSGHVEVERVVDKSNYKRSVTAPRLREQQRRTTSPMARGMVLNAPSVAEINEIIAEVKLSNDPSTLDESMTSTTESIQPGDLFFSRESSALQGKKSSLLPQKLQQYGYYSPSPAGTAMSPHIRGLPASSVEDESNGNGMNIRGIASSGVSRSSSAVTSRKGGSSMTSDGSVKTTDSMRKFTANRKKSQKDASWFACMRTGNCRTSMKSPERKRPIEASFIGRAIVVETLPQFWADKHQPASLNGFICNKQEAQLLKELVSQGSCPHILLKGPSGSGKRELAMALLREIYGDACCNMSHELRSFPIQDKRPIKVCVSIASSAHHMELNVSMEPNAKYALLGLIKEISNIYAMTPEVSNVNFKPDYKVILLYGVDKAVENIQHMIKWIIDRYSDICKLVLCCEDDAAIVEPVKNRFKIIKVDAPQTHQIAEVLIHIAKKEEIDVSLNFAAKIAIKSKQNLRKAIMALEACKAHNYPFSEEQPIPIGWEDMVIEVAAEILADPSFSRLLSIRGKFQMLLLDFVHPKLILQKLVEELLKRIEVSLKREVYYWHAYYERRLPPGTTALLKLEEFVAKFMSIYRKSCGTQQYV
ncbi:hypothetical protein HN51_068644 [Arachis hypogaea]|uniref:uncharacterized protein n=1 Tax=Arachis hypogaea TaxID=3818 RepID=UPI00110572FB|nr:uncharacterized protein LOC112747893 [Arachis hypogaea]QHO10738.1 Replication factor C subunit [Arachis hypogaea]